MPNHYTTVCFVTGPAEGVAAFVARHVVPREDGKGEFFDLGTVVPKPAVVDKTESGSQADAGFFALTGMHHVSFARFTETPMERDARAGFPMHVLSQPTGDYKAWLAEKHPEALVKGQAQLDCFRETGHLSWYEWSYANWGTKWNSYDFELRSSEPGRYVFKFETANGMPVPVFEALTKLHPALFFATQTIDEGGPEFTGEFSAKLCRHERAPESDERYRLCYGKARPNYDEDDSDDSDDSDDE
jgi:hypothetical protein